MTTQQFDGNYLTPSSISQIPKLFLRSNVITIHDEFIDEATEQYFNKHFFGDEVQINHSNGSKNLSDSFGKTILSSLNEIFIFDAKTFKFLDVSKGALLNVGYSLVDLRKLTPLDIKPEFDMSSFKNLLIPLQNKTKEKVTFTTMHKRKDGSVYPAEIHLQLLSFDDRAAFVAFSIDMTNHVQEYENLKSMAHYDTLTRLPNRVLFSDRLQQAIAHSKRNESLLAICFLDLDNFKAINDNFGHHIGDKLLLEVAQRIQSEIREGDTVSRLGGDEFTLLLGGIKSFPQCEQMLERIHHSLSRPYQIDGHEHYISASTGVTIYPLDESDSYNLVCHADSAMYQAKSTGKNKFHFYSVLDSDNNSK